MDDEDDDIQDYKKPWVGLTDEERKEMDAFVSKKGWSHSRGMYLFADLIEAKLKEKNG